MSIWKRVYQYVYWIALLYIIFDITSIVESGVLLCVGCCSKPLGNFKFLIRITQIVRLCISPNINNNTYTQTRKANLFFTLLSKLVAKVRTGCTMWIMCYLQESVNTRALVAQTVVPWFITKFLILYCLFWAHEQ